MENKCSGERGGRGVLICYLIMTFGLFPSCFSLFFYALPFSVTLVYYLLWDELGQLVRRALIPSRTIGAS